MVANSVCSVDDCCLPHELRNSLCLDLHYSELIREPAAEFFGVMILIIFGAGVDCQVVLSANTNVASTPKGVSAHHISPIVVY